MTQSSKEHASLTDPPKRSTAQVDHLARRGGLELADSSRSDRCSSLDRSATLPTMATPSSPLVFADPQRIRICWFPRLTPDGARAAGARPLRQESRLVRSTTRLLYMTNPINNRMDSRFRANCGFRTLGSPWLGIVLCRAGGTARTRHDLRRYRDRPVPNVHCRAGGDPVRGDHVPVTVPVYPVGLSWPASDAWWSAAATSLGARTRSLLECRAHCDDGGAGSS
jgi:hypothetical protein